MHLKSKFTAIAAFCALSAFSFTALAADGEFIGQAEGRNAPVKVSVKIANGKIEDVQVIEHQESPGISDPAIAIIPQQIVEHQTVGVDNISGASLSSQAIIGAVTEALKLAGLNPEDYSAKVAHVSAANNPPENVETDILVIGGGNAGIAAAVKALMDGKKVVLIEKRTTTGGVSALNHGGFAATGTRYQREEMKEDKDSPELFYQDMLKSGRGINDPVVAKMVTEKTGEVGDWLIDELKIPYGAAWAPFPDHSASRQISAKGNSTAWQKQMMDVFNQKGGVLLTNVRANELVVNDNGDVIEVKASGIDDQPYSLKAKSYVLASGGYGADRDMFPDKKEHVLFYGLPTETGDGLKMGQKIGADTVNLGEATTYPNGVEVQPGRSIDTTGSSSFALKKSAIFVNTDGNRVINENAGLGDLAQATMKAKDHILYLVMDEDAYKAYVQKALDDHTFTNPQVFENWKTLINNGKPAHCEGTLEHCAEVMGINPEALAATVAKWNEDVKAGKDSQFGRETLVAIGEGPYHIIEQKARYQTTLGGLKANENMEILRKDGTPIKNLYGAGSVVGGANGAHPLPTLMNTWAIVSGYVAGENAVKNAQ